MPIMSQHKWNVDGHRTLTDAWGGITVHTASDTDDPVILRNGVYFIKMLLPDHVVNQDFTRPGPM